MTMPNFLIVGAAKAGTTSLVHYLQQHPQIYFSPRKEPRFFAFEEGERLSFAGPNDYRSDRNARGNNPGINNTSVTTLDKYQSLFDGVTQETAIGEASTLYLYSPEAPSRIKQYVPDMKIIIMLRNPVERAYSSYLHLVRDGYETLSFEESLQAEESRIEDNWSHLWHYKSSGFYHGQVERYYQNFNSSHIKIYLDEELRQAPQDVLADIYDFIGVKDTVSPDFGRKLNQSGVPKNKLLHRFLTTDNLVKRSARRLVPHYLRQQAYQSIRKKNLAKKPDLDSDTRLSLRNTFEEDIVRLQRLIDKDLSSWLADEKPVHSS